MAKRWLVYAFTEEDYEAGAAKNGLIKAIDPDNPGELLTLKVSDHDCDDLDDWIGASGSRPGWWHIPGGSGIYKRIWREATKDIAIPFGWEFDDPIEIVEGRPM